MSVPPQVLSLFASIWVAVLGGCAAQVFTPTQQDGFHARTLSIGGVAHRYQVYTPPGFTPDRRWPVVVFLHGGGEIGADGARQTQEGLGPALYEDRRAGGGRYPFVALFPQCPQRRFWASPDIEAMVLAALDRTMAEFSGDPDRVYLTGISFGGYGTWLLGSRHPERFAALLPISAGVRPPRAVPVPRAAFIADPAVDPYRVLAGRVGRTPVWVFHGEEDWLIPVKEARRVVAALREAKADVRYTEYPGTGHDAWEETYRDEAVLRWMLAQRRGAP